MIARIVEPEWLDLLPPDDPRAVASRADLQWINRLMGHASQISKLFWRYNASRAIHGRRLRIADLGGGDGTLLLRLAQDWATRGIQADAEILDAHPAVAPTIVQAFCKLGWTLQIRTVDALHWAKNKSSSYDLILCNLFLHHFKKPQLATLLTGIARQTDLFIACEPRRSNLGLWGASALRLIRCSSVTLHDARVSVLAGFASRELSHLWPASPSSSQWELSEGEKLFSHYFTAMRR